MGRTAWPFLRMIGRVRAGRVADSAVEALRHAWPNARLTGLVFGDGQLEALGAERKALVESDLSLALQQVMARPGEAPRAIVVPIRRPPQRSVRLSGWLGWRGTRSADAGCSRSHGRGGSASARDRSIRAVRLTGSAIAHQPFTLHIEVGCSQGIDCEDVKVGVRELMREVRRKTWRRARRARLRTGSVSIWR